MPAVTRLGVTSLWRNSERFSQPSQPFFQEIALNSLISGYLKTEHRVDLVWNSALIYSNGIRSHQTGIRSLHLDTMTDYFVSWEIVRYRNMDAPFTQWVKKVKDCESFDVLRARVNRLDSACIVSAHIMPRTETDGFSISCMNSFFSDVLSVWSVYRGSRSLSRRIASTDSDR